MFTQRHYIALAKVMGESLAKAQDAGNYNLVYDTVYEPLTDMLRADNDRFDRQRFQDAVVESYASVRRSPCGCARRDDSPECPDCNPETTVKCVSIPVPEPTVAPYRVVINEAFEDETLRGIASQEMTYVMNCTGGRPSDAARSAVLWLKKAIQYCDAEKLSSPAAQAMFKDWVASTR